jgi:uncharacterized protein (TIGR01244 family)
MTVQLNRVADDVLTAPQLAPGDLPDLARRGIRSVINNRPDGEGGPDQPTSTAMADAAAAAGLDYAYLPVVSSAITQQDVARFGDLIERLPKPIVAFCRSGSRSGKLYAAAKDLARKA